MKNICERLPLKISTSVTIFPKEDFLFNLILSILNVAIMGWFFHVTCVAKVSLLLLKKLQHKSCNIFITKKLHTSSEMYHSLLVEIIVESVDLIQMSK